MIIHCHGYCLTPANRRKIFEKNVHEVHGHRGKSVERRRT
jgi:hypothetical protein